MSRNIKQKKLTPKQRKAIEALLGGFNQADVAVAAGVSVQTIHRWQNTDASFQAELEKLSFVAVNDASRRLAGTLDLAVDTFRRVMADPEASDALQLRAANYAATHALKLLETAEIMQRLDAIESSLGIAS